MGRAMRIIFMGTPGFAVPALDALVAAGHDVAAVFTRPPRPAHRGRRETRSAVHQRAIDLGLSVQTPAERRGAIDAAQIAALGADIAVVAAYGVILSQAVLDALPLGCLNIHASLLPRWRGAAPIQRAILAGDRETGVAIMQMAAGLDTGPVRAVAATPIAGKTATALTAELAEMGARLMVAVLADRAGHPARAQPDAGVLYAPKVTKDESRIDWHLAAVQVERMVRAFADAPGAWFDIAGERVRLLAAEVAAPSDEPAAVRPGTVIDDRLTIACNPGALRCLTVQRAGRGVMPAGDLLRGFPVPAGTRLD